MNDGSDQGRRYPEALEAGYFGVDETSFEQLVATTAQLGERLRFHGGPGGEGGSTASGTWAELFHADETMVMAEIAAFDVARHLPQHDGFESAAPELASDRMLALASTVNRWVTRLSQFSSPASRAVHEYATRLVAQHLAPEFKAVLAWRGEAWEGALMRAVERLDAGWGVQGITDARRIDADQEDLHAPPFEREAPRMEYARLRAAVHAFRSGISRLSLLAREQMERSMKYPTHDPSAGLLLAFMRLLQTVQHQANRFADRHIDFYYDEVLRMRPRPAAADRVHLVSRIDASAREVLLAAGTQFSAGKDLDGRPVLYRSDEAAVLNDAKVAALMSVRLERNPLISPEVELGFVTRIKAARLPIADATPIDAVHPDAIPPHWPLFGGSARQAGPGQPEEARIGVAIASPILLLAEGERQIDVTLRLSFPAESDADAAALLRECLALKKEKTGTTTCNALLAQLFKRYLALDPSLLDAAEAASPQVRDALVARMVDRVQFRLDECLADEASCWRVFATELLIDSQSRAVFATRLGKLSSRWLQDDAAWMGVRDLRRLRTVWRRYAPRTLKDMRLRLRHRPKSGDGTGAVREPLFNEFFAQIFEVSLTTASGWHAVSDVSVGRVTGAAGCLTLSVRLRSRDPGVTACSALHAAAFHGVVLPNESPVMLLRLRSESRLSPYSLLADAMLSEVKLKVAVRGLRSLALSNQLGRLDASKPFNPFGPLPVRGSYLVFGAAELAAKNLTQLALNLEWCNLPEAEGGFETHYEGYESRYDNRVFTAAIAVLRDGRWQPQDEQLHGTTMFRSAAGDRLRTRSTMRLDSNTLRNEFRASAQPVAADEFLFGPAVGNGFFKLQLTGPAYAFGHQEYPGLLTKVLTANARSKRPRAIPNAPYTPALDRITLDYNAESTIVVGRASLAEAGIGAERVFVLHPFGVEQMHPASAADAQRWLLPRFPCDGNLYIGMACADLSGSLSLHFHLRDESALARDAPAPVVHWDCLDGNRWIRLAADRVLSDTTRGFLTSGIVSLDLPAGLRTDTTVMPAGLYWLRLCTASGFDSFASLYAVRTQAHTATLADVATVRSARLVLPAGTIKEAATSVPGLLAVEQIGPSFGRRAAETPREMRTRTSERLSHKNRCTSPWDYERLVLQEFPEVCRVKCFPHLSTRAAGPSPGHVLVVVIPAFSAEGEEARTPTPRMNVDRLERIAEFLRAHASPFVKLEVRNAAYERIQVRCSVRLKRDHPSGLTLKRINQAIVHFLSPWEEGGLGVHFGWSIAPVDVEARLRRIEAVESVSRLSLLQVAATSESLYMLADSARPADGTIKARLPWSIAVPMAQHIIDAGELAAGGAPEVSGVQILELGNTFVLGAAAVSEGSHG